MTNKLYKNEKGFTLVELLAAISLFAILIALSSATIIQLLNSEDKTSNQVTLRQDTNVLISELRGQYYDKNDPTLCLEIDNKRLSIHQITINEEKVTLNNNCIESVDKKEPLEIELTTVNDGGQTLSIHSAWDNKEEYVMTVVLNNGDQGEYDNKDKFEDIVIDEEEKDDYTEPESNWQNGGCVFVGNSKFPQGSWGSWNACDETAVISGNTWLPPNSTINGVSLIVDKDLYADGSFTLESDANIIVKNNAKIEGQVVLKATSSMEVNNLYAKNDFTIQEDAQLHTKGGVRIVGPLEVKSHGKLLIDGHFFTEGQTIFQEQTEIIIGKNATFESSLNMMKDATLNIGGQAIFHDSVNIQEENKITIDGDATFESSLNMMKNAIVKIGENAQGDAHFYGSVNLQNNNKLIIEGNAIFDGPVGYDYGHGTICIKGNATYTTVHPNLNFIENATSCN